MSEPTRYVDLAPGDASRALAGLPQDAPIVMLNLLRFRDVARYADGDEAAGAPCSGREAYLKRYSRVSVRTIAAVGGSVVFGAEALASLIGSPGEAWHQVFLVRYPSVAAFAAMLAMPEYQAAVRHRTAALEDSRLVAMLAPAPGPTAADLPRPPV